MQMAKTSAALSRLDGLGGLAISVLCNPTTGGVMASYAALGDVILAEPRALIGFAGPRVIQETLRTELPEGFQTAEFLLERGFIDRIVERKDLPATLALIIDTLWTYTPEQLHRFAPPPLEEPAEEEAADSEGGAEGSSEAVPEAPEAVAARERAEAATAEIETPDEADSGPPAAEARTDASA
jgi:acetyl-CoA carboxylase carboxyl transferase subunit beta